MPCTGKTQAINERVGLATAHYRSGPELNSGHRSGRASIKAHCWSGLGLAWANVARAELGSTAKLTKASAMAHCLGPGRRYANAEGHVHLGS